ncbi:MAG TPA: hypothetical protein VMV33_17440 [Rhodocyclaceae bacterium]|nr:hypothetical protein [Rhodocyclaceae bacterium]
MTNPSVTIRHAAHALDMLINGALRNIEAEFGPEDDAGRRDATKALFDKLLGKLVDWDIEGAIVTQQDAMVSQMQTEIEAPIQNMRVVELLNEFNLLP